jgi:hypothetical protein
VVALKPMHFEPPPALRALLIANANLADAADEDPARPILDGDPLDAAAVAAANGMEALHEEAPVATPKLDITIATAQQFLRDCINATPRVGYGLGAKIVPVDTAVPGRDFTKVDCSGFVRAALLRAAVHPPLDFPDGSVVQHDWVESHGFAEVDVAAGQNTDGIVRIAFLRPQDAPSHIGHVALLYAGQTIESHGGLGPDSRPWTGTGWQALTQVYVLTAP